MSGVPSLGDRLRGPVSAASSSRVRHTDTRDLSRSTTVSTSRPLRRSGLSGLGTVDRTRSWVWVDGERDSHCVRNEPSYLGWTGGPATLVGRESRDPLQDGDGDGRRRAGPCQVLLPATTETGSLVPSGRWQSRARRGLSPSPGPTVPRLRFHPVQLPRVSVRVFDCGTCLDWRFPFLLEFRLSSLDGAVSSGVSVSFPYLQGMCGPRRGGCVT